MVKYFIIYFHFYSQGNIGCAKVSYVEWGDYIGTYRNKQIMQDKVAGYFGWQKSTATIDSVVEVSESVANSISNKFDAKIEWSLTDNN